MDLNTDTNASTTALNVEQEEEQQQTEQVTDQQPDDVSGQTPILSQPVKTEHQDPPTDSESTPAPESSVQLNGLVKDHLSVIDEKMETSKDCNLCMPHLCVIYRAPQPCYDELAAIFYLNQSECPI